MTSKNRPLLILLLLASFVARADSAPTPLVTKVTALAQAFALWTEHDKANPFGCCNFGVRRARLGVLGTYNDQHSLYLELEGAASDGAALSEARLNLELPEKYLQLRAGKFKHPLSAENFGSVATLDTIARSTTLETLVGSGSLDHQIGLGLFGEVEIPSDYAQELRYALVVFNGENSLSSNGSGADTNEDKEFVAKLGYQAADNLVVGMGYAQKREPSANVSVRSTSGALFLSGLTYGGNARIVEADLAWRFGLHGLNGEILYARLGDELSLQGGHVTATWMLSGNRDDGFEVVARFDTLKVTGPGRAGINGDRLQTALIGANWYLNEWVKAQINYLHHETNGPGNATFKGRITEEVVLTQLQAKF